MHGDGVACGEFFKVRVLGYADDAAMLDRDTQALTIRLTTLADAAKHEADMEASIPKTFSQHVAKRTSISVTKAEAAAEKTAFKCKHKCDFCERRFKSNRDILIHRNNCVHQYNTTDGTFVVEDIVGVFELRPGGCW